MRSFIPSLPAILIVALILLPSGVVAEETCFPSYKVCFNDYTSFAEARTHLLSQGGLKLNQYIADLCFLERLSPEQVAELNKDERAVLRSLRRIHLEDIIPLLSDPQTKAVTYGSCYTGLTEIPDELMVRLDSSAQCAPQIKKLFDFLNLNRFDPLTRKLLSVNSLADSAALTESLRRLFGLAGPSKPADQVKVNLGQLKSFLPDLSFLASTDKRRADLAEILDLSGVRRIDPFEYATPRNGTTAGVIQSGRRDSQSLFGHGLHGEGQTVGLIDDFLDTGHCFLDDPQGDFPGNQHRKLQSYQPPDLSNPPSLHGTFVAGIIAGSSSKNLAELNNGQAPAARISFTSIWDIAAHGPIASVLYQALQDQYKEGARIFSNSWGDKESGAYTNWAYDVDRFSREREDTLVLFAVNNDGPVLSPENAKNALAVGASKQADLQEDIGRAGTGPTCDGQRKPEIFAPGCQIRSAIAGTACGVGPAPIQHGHIAPAELPLHGTTCATSWACPAVAGAAALARQYMIQQHAHTPSGALLRAILLNGTRDMTGVEGYPSDREGWGRLVLDDALFFSGDERNSFMDDVWNAQGFDTDAHPYVRRVKVRVGSTQDLKVTLAWTDPPPAQSSRHAVLVNDLDLRVEKLTCAQAESCHFLGNVFAEGASQAFSTFPEAKVDANTVEQVLIAHSTGPSTTADYCISVVGKQIHMPRQGYALVVSGSVERLPPTDDCRDGAL
jgi:hypothetical protein